MWIAYPLAANYPEDIESVFCLKQVFPVWIRFAPGILI